MRKNCLKQLIFINFVVIILFFVCTKEKIDEPINQQNLIENDIEYEFYKTMTLFDNTGEQYALVTIGSNSENNLSDF